PIVILCAGQGSRLLFTADRIRSADSRTVVSGKPVHTIFGRPVPTSASTLTRCASSPASATDWVRPSAITTPRPSQHPAKVLESGPAVLRHHDAHDVEPDGPPAFPVLLEPGQRELAQLVGLAAGDRFRRTAERGRRPGLHLGDDEDVAVARDDVDLAGRTPPVARENLEPRTDEMPRREVLAVLPDCILGEHATTSATQCAVAAEVRSAIGGELWRRSATWRAVNESA